MSEHDDRPTRPGDHPEPQTGLLATPRTDDLVIDASLAELAETGTADLAAQLEAGERVDLTLRSRLADLGG